MFSKTPSKPMGALALPGEQEIPNTYETSGCPLSGEQPLGLIIGPIDAPERALRTSGVRLSGG